MEQIFLNSTKLGTPKEELFSGLKELLKKNNEEVAASAFDTIGTALYDLREKIAAMQQSHLKKTFGRVYRGCCLMQIFGNRNGHYCTSLMYSLFRSNRWFIGPLPLPKSNMAASAPEM